MLTHFKTKSCTNLSETEFWHKKKTSTETKIFKKCNFGDRNDRNWLKNDESPGESFPFTYFHLKSSTNLPQTKFWCQKQNDDRNENFQKNAMSEAKTMEFGWKAMNLLRSLICWPISNQKVALICLKRNSGAKNKTTTGTKILKKMPCRMPKRWNLA